MRGVAADPPQLELPGELEPFVIARAPLVIELHPRRQTAIVAGLVLAVAAMLVVPIALFAQGVPILAPIILGGVAIWLAVTVGADLPRRWRPRLAIRFTEEKIEVTEGPRGTPRELWRTSVARVEVVETWGRYAQTPKGPCIIVEAEPPAPRLVIGNALGTELALIRALARVIEQWQRDGASSISAG